MRRSDREIKSFDEIVDVLSRCDTIRIGMIGGGYPYVVPLSFGYEITDGKIVIYIHGAKEGKKHDLILKNNKVCVEADLCHRFVDTIVSVTAEYESIIGFGEAIIVFDDEAIKGLDLILKHCGYENKQYYHDTVQIVTVYKITLDEVTGKRRTV